MYNLLVELFKIDTNKNKVTVIKEPYKRDVVFETDKDDIERLIKKYNYFKTKEEDGVITFSQDLFDETNMSYSLKKKYNEEFGEYYRDDEPVI